MRIFVLVHDGNIEAVQIQHPNVGDSARYQIVRKGILAELGQSRHYENISKSCELEEMVQEMKSQNVFLLGRMKLAFLKLRLVIKRYQADF